MTQHLSGKKFLISHIFPSLKIIDFKENQDSCMGGQIREY